MSIEIERLEGNRFVLERIWIHHSLPDLCSLRLPLPYPERLLRMPTFLQVLRNIFNHSQTPVETKFTANRNVSEKAMLQSYHLGLVIVLPSPHFQLPLRHVALLAFGVFILDFSQEFERNSSHQICFSRRTIAGRF